MHVSVYAGDVGDVRLGYERFDSPAHCFGAKDDVLFADHDQDRHDVIELWRATGPGWQSRMADRLRKVRPRGRPDEPRRPRDTNVSLRCVYANLNDLRKWTEVAATYLEDGEMIRPSAPDHPIVGREAILKSLLARPADRCTKHFCANVVVTVLSEREATAYSAYQIYSGACEAENPLPLLDKKPPTICEFHDRLALTPDGWRFRRRQGVVLFRAG